MKSRDLTGQTFGEWEVLEFNGGKTYKCRCSCGKVKDVRTYHLINGTSTSCGHAGNKRLIDLTGKTFGEWEVLEKGKTGTYGETTWLCKCSCGNIKEIKASSLKSGASKSCGHEREYKDLTGKTFGEWLVIERAGSRESREPLWLCKCSCGTVKEVGTKSLVNGTSKSCGCKKVKLYENKCKEKYGVRNYKQLGLTEHQIEAYESKEKLLKFIESNFKVTPTISELCNKLGRQKSSVLGVIHKYELEQFVELLPRVSSYENELLDLFPTEHTSNRKALGNGKELDLYYPDKKLAIEFNGDYWHCELNKDRLYHQNKTIDGAKKGIQVFYIFEYEWRDEATKSKIIKLLDRKINNNVERVYARNCSVNQIEPSIANEFIEKYHLQGVASAPINYGCMYNGQLVGVMTIGKARFNSNFQYELIRLAWKDDVAVTGGTEKMFKHFLSEFNPQSIVSYCDISKFTGNVYTRLGFKATKKSITAPNYKWVDVVDGKTMSRHQTMKSKLVELGLGEDTETEAEIMQRLGYLRIYDSGNLRMEWFKEE